MKKIVHSFKMLHGIYTQVTQSAFGNCPSTIHSEASVVVPVIDETNSTIPHDDSCKHAATQTGEEKKNKKRSRYVDMDFEKMSEPSN